MRRPEAVMSQGARRMTMHTKPPATAAEQTLFDTFAANAAKLPGGKAVNAMRERLMNELKATGLPTRRVEAWHYTDLRTLLRNVPAEMASGEIAPVPTLIEGADRLTVVNGAHPLGDAPKGVSVTSFAERLADAAIVNLLTDHGTDDVIGRINGALVSGGAALDVAPGTKLSAPLELQVVHGSGQAHTRFPVGIGAGASGTIVERHCGTGAGFTTSVTDLVVGDGAEITWIILQAQGATDTHFGQLNLRLGADAKLMLYVVNAGGKLVRQEIRGAVEGEGADMKLRGVNLVGGEAHCDVTLVLGHNVPDTISTEIMRNVVFDRAQGVFQGQIRVAPDAQKTDAKMACNTLLLSDEADFSTKPELEIFADDVQCGHGATVADIDENHLFYLTSRGIPEARARAMLVNAFVAEIIEELEDEPVIAALEGVVTDWLEAHG